MRIRHRARPPGSCRRRCRGRRCRPGFPRLLRCARDGHRVAPARGPARRTAGRSPPGDAFSLPGRASAFSRAVSATSSASPVAVPPLAPGRRAPRARRSGRWWARSARAGSSWLNPITPTRRGPARRRALSRSAAVFAAGRAGSADVGRLHRGRLVGHEHDVGAARPARPRWPAGRATATMQHGDARQRRAPSAGAGASPAPSGTTESRMCGRTNAAAARRAAALGERRRPARAGRRASASRNRGAAKLTAWRPAPGACRA